jgi:hypothetical protein
MISWRHVTQWHVKPVLAWYDMWVGAFWDRRTRKLYVLPIPCIGIVIDFSPTMQRPEAAE